jgi:hypothetical protein
MRGRGLEALIEAMKDVPLQLVIIGEGDLSDDLRQAVDQGGLNEKIVFTGRKATPRTGELHPFSVCRDEPIGEPRD